MQKLAEITVRRVASTNPAFDWLAAHDAICELDRLAGEIDRPPAITAVAALDAPIAAGGAVFHRLSWAASEWLHDYAWKRLDAVSPLLVSAWALAHSRNAAALRAAWGDAGATEASIRQWAAGLACPVEALPLVIEALTPAPPPFAEESSVKEAEKAPYGEILDDLVSEYGNTPDHWLFDEPLDRLMEMHGAIVRRKLVEMAAQRGVAFEAPKSQRAQRAHWCFMKAAKAFAEQYGSV